MAIIYSSRHVFARRTRMQRGGIHLGRSIPFVRRPESDGEIVSRAQSRKQNQVPYQQNQQEKEWTPWGYEPKQPLPDLPENRDPIPDKPQPANDDEPQPQPQSQPPQPLPRFHMYDDLNLQQPAQKRPRKKIADDLESQTLPRREQRRLGRSVYDAMQTHGHFGLVDGGETYAGGIRRIVLHVPKRSRGYALDIKPGEVIYANSARGRPVGGRLDVLYVSRHKYVSPGHAVTSCVIGVPEHQWSRFMD